MSPTDDDMARLAELFESYRIQLLTMIRRRIDPSLAARIDPEDILNNAFLIAKDKNEDLARMPRGDAYPWLYRITLDAIIDAWRRETRDRRDVLRTMPWPDGSLVSFASVLADGGTSPSTAVDRELQRQRVQHILSLLTAGEQEILWMRHFDQLTHCEISEILGTSESTANVRYVRALRHMKQLWNKTYKR